MQAQLTVRRARRDDFARVRALCGLPAEASRADRKRFRRLVSTLREDLYVVEDAAAEALAGFAVVAYVRGLGPATALVRELHGSPEAAVLLLASARRHAAARGCTRLELDCELPPGAPDDGTWQPGARIRWCPVAP